MIFDGWLDLPVWGIFGTLTAETRAQRCTLFLSAKPISM
ncbi:MAG: hypothetical protein K0S56_4541 [Microvirga sp.]|nr:hypothetical protein [Microvirga sp.]